MKFFQLNDMLVLQVMHVIHSGIQFEAMLNFWVKRLYFIMVYVLIHLVL